MGGVPWFSSILPRKLIETVSNRTTTSSVQHPFVSLSI
jgi:hypothetical protein